MRRHPMTAVGSKKLQSELNRLKTVERRRIAQLIAEASAHGDLKENAEYHAARELQSFNEGRINDLESKFAQAEIIDVSKLPHNGKVVFGVTVHLVNQSDDKEVVYQIVGIDEADLKHGKISVTSPIARSLIGREVDEFVEVDAPSGFIEYQITKIDYL